MAQLEPNAGTLRQIILQEARNIIQSTVHLNSNEREYEAEVRNIKTNEFDWENQLQSYFNNENGNPVEVGIEYSPQAIQDEIESVKDNLHRIREITEVEKEKVIDEKNREYLIQKWLHIFWRHDRIMTHIAEPQRVNNLNLIYNILHELMKGRISKPNIPNQTLNAPIPIPTTTIPNSQHRSEERNNDLIDVNDDLLSMNEDERIRYNSVGYGCTDVHSRGMNERMNALSINEHEDSVRDRVRWNNLEHAIRSNSNRNLDHHKELQRMGILFTDSREGVSLSTYLYKLHRYMDIHKVSGDEILDHIHCTLKSGPNEWYWSIFERRKGQKNFTVFEEQIQRRYGKDNNSAAMLTTAVENRYRGGSMLIYTENMVRLLSESDLKERMKIDLIKNGFPQNVGQILSTRSITSIDELMYQIKELFPRDSIEVDSGYKKPEPNFKSNSFKARPNVSVLANEVNEGNNAENNEQSDTDEEDAIPQLCAMFKRFMESHNKRKMNKPFKNNNTMGSSSTSSPSGYDSKVNRNGTKCFNCFSDKHYFANCYKEQVGYFCYSCGKRDVVFTKCNNEECIRKRETSRAAESKN